MSTSLSPEIWSLVSAYIALSEKNRFLTRAFIRSAMAQEKEACKKSNNHNGKILQFVVEA